MAPATRLSVPTEQKGTLQVVVHPPGSAEAVDRFGVKDEAVVSLPGGGFLTESKVKEVLMRMRAMSSGPARIGAKR